jgi:hypothetical protein
VAIIDHLVITVAVRLDGPMQSVSIFMLAAVALIAAAAASAAPSPPSHVSELVVVGGPPPKVTTSFPAQGVEVAAGVLAIKLVFDQAMTAEGWSYGHAEVGEFPTCLAQPRLLADQRTFVLLCTVAAHKTYAIEVNAAPAFVGANGRLASPSVLRFSTNDTIVRTMHDALVQADLTDADEPIMKWRDDGVGVSRSPPPSDPGAAPHP